jgi:hypothetical protein
MFLTQTRPPGSDLALEHEKGVAVGTTQRSCSPGAAEEPALSFADEAAIMVNGELVRQGKRADIRSDVVGAHLGAESPP